MSRHRAVRNRAYSYDDDYDDDYDDYDDEEYEDEEAAQYAHPSSRCVSWGCVLVAPRSFNL